MRADRIENVVEEYAPRQLVRLQEILARSDQLIAYITIVEILEVP
jgi:hypothetical protein